MAKTFHTASASGPVTSVDLVRRQKYATTATSTTSGVKRNFNTLTSTPGDDSPTIAVHVQLRDIGVRKLARNRLQASSITGPGEPGHGRTEYTQRLQAASTPGPTAYPALALSHAQYGLPSQLIRNLQDLGIHSIYPWQANCLSHRGVLDDSENLVYTAPTGGGKSLVADIILLKKVLEDPSRKACLVLPYVALVQEKLKWFRKVTENLTLAANGSMRFSSTQQDSAMRRRPVQVTAFFGGSRSRTTWSDTDIAICTIEKANSMINSAIEDNTLHDLGVLVVDELHMLGDENRGYILELLLTKVRHLNLGIQIIGMSATISNPALLAKWLDAKFYISNYRPIPIEEHIVYNGQIYSTDDARGFLSPASQGQSTVSTQQPIQSLRSVVKSLHRELENPVTNAVVALAIETMLAGYGALIFCSSRSKVQNMAQLISQTVATDSISPTVLAERQNVLAALQAAADGFEDTFNATILCGVGFHHAGLTVEEREIVADAFDRGVLRIMVATCSLGAGINLPARRVILDGTKMGMDYIGPAMLRQMRGRAGRKGKDEVGETYLCCHKAELEAVAMVLDAELPAVESRLDVGNKGVKRALLEAVAVGLCSTTESAKAYVQSSLLWHTNDHQCILELATAALDELLRLGLLNCLEPEGLEASKLGCAIVASALSPEDGVFIHAEMQRALESFAMDTDMQVLYLFTPIQSMGTLDISWPVFRDELDRSDEAAVRALRLMGINPALVNRMVQSGTSLKERNAEEVLVARTYRRAYTAFQLRDLCDELDINTVSQKYSVPRGFVQSLAQNCQGFAAGMIKFSQRMGWDMLAAVLEHTVDRLRAGARSDLLEMAQIIYIKSRMARTMWENGFRSVQALAEANPHDLVPIMLMTKGAKARQHGDTLIKLKQRLLEKAEIIVQNASRIWERRQLAEIDEY